MRHGEVTLRIEELLAPSLSDGVGDWWADYVRLRFAARKNP
jgi:hypothetical protein